MSRRYGYNLIQQTGSHLRLISNYKGHADYVSVPRHSYVKIDTLIDILNHVATHLEIDRDELARQLFGR